MYKDCEDFVTIPRLKLLRFETELACAHITRLAHFPGSNAVLAGTDKGSLQARLKNCRTVRFRIKRHSKD